LFVFIMKVNSKSLITVSTRVVNSREITFLGREMQFPGLSWDSQFCPSTWSESDRQRGVNEVRRSLACPRLPDDVRGWCQPPSQPADNQHSGRWRAQNVTKRLGGYGGGSAPGWQVRELSLPPSPHWIPLDNQSTSRTIIPFTIGLLLGSP